MVLGSRPVRFIPRKVITGWEVHEAAVAKRKSLSLQRMGNRTFRLCMMVPDEMISFMYCLLIDDDSSSGYIALNVTVSNDDELERRWKETHLV
jgi:hypothetical protein